MLNPLFVSVIGLLFFSCATPGSKIPVELNDDLLIEQNFWDIRPVDGFLVVIGGSAAHTRKSEAIEAAVNDAVRWLSVYSQGVTGSITQILASGTSYFDYLQDDTLSSITYPENQQDYRADLIYDPVKDVLEFQNAVYVRVRYPLPSYPRINYPNTVKTSRPGWIDNPPETISDYHVGIGMAKARVNHRNTVIASYENAIFTLISAAAIHIQSMEEYADSSAMNSVQQKNISIHTANGSVEGFYVLEIWTDPKDMSVWTLAIAQNCIVN